MKDSNTQKTNNPRSFEERIFLRFDAVDERLGSIEDRVGKLEMKQYDTKPIWEQALHEITHSNERIDQLTTTVTLTNERVDQLTTTVTQTNERVDQLTTTVAQTNERVDQLTTTVTQTNERVDLLTTTVAQTNDRVDQLATSLVKTDSRVEQVTTSVELLRSDMKAEFSTLRNEIEDSFHDVEWKLDALNNTMLKMQADHRFIGRHLRDLESQSKPT